MWVHPRPRPLAPVQCRCTLHRLRCRRTSCSPDRSHSRSRRYRRSRGNCHQLRRSSVASLLTISGLPQSRHRGVMSAVIHPTVPASRRVPQPLQLQPYFSGFLLHLLPVDGAGAGATRIICMRSTIRTQKLVYAAALRGFSLSITDALSSNWRISGVNMRCVSLTVCGE